MTYPFTNFANFNGCTVEVWEWISNFIPHYTRCVIAYPCWDETQAMLIKGAPGGVCIPNSHHHVPIHTKLLVKYLDSEQTTV